MDVPITMQPYGDVFEMQLGDQGWEMPKTSRFAGLKKPKGMASMKPTGTTPMKPKKLGGLKKLKGL